MAFASSKQSLTEFIAHGVAIDGDLRALGQLLVVLVPPGGALRITATAHARQALHGLVLQRLALVVAEDLNRLGRV